MAKLIVIIGNVGSGKTTLTNSLAKALKARIIQADSLYKTNPFFPLTVKDRKRWSLASDLWFLLGRAKLMKKINRLKSRYVVVDSGMPMSWIYSHSRIKNCFFSKDEWELYESLSQKINDDLPKIDILIELTGSIDFLMNEIKKRGREYELKYFNREYIASLAYSIKYCVRKYKKEGIKVITVNREKHDLTNTVEFSSLLNKIQKNIHE
jgi:deoxyguanosine kinase